MKHALGGAVAGIMLTLGLLAIAEDPKPQPPGAGNKPPEEVWLEGEVIDLTSYLKDGSSGKDHWKVARAHIRNGTPAALLTFDGRLFVITPYNRDGFAPLQNAGEVVRIRGVVYERDGVKCVVAKESKKLPPDYKPEGGDGARHGGGDGGSAKVAPVGGDKR
ncbi:MAG: hypothetical protein HUU15_07855 [Candidatus Brocadiae bacterium]|nr:hypothetical protein [Candidatus Brocadiia bacterium]